MLGENALRILGAVPMIVDSLTYLGEALIGPSVTPADLLAVWTRSGSIGPWSCP